MKSILTFLTSLSLFALMSSVQAEPIEVGDPAPKLIAKDHAGKEVDLEKEFAEGTVLVYFYPKADTQRCTKQACTLRDEFEAVKEAGIKVFGVSADKVEDQKAFQTKYELPFTLLADEDGKVIEAFGVPTSGRGFASRQSFLIKEGKIVWRDLQATP